jgi:hypothetical protein
MRIVKYTLGLGDDDDDASNLRRAGSILTLTRSVCYLCESSSSANQSSKSENDRTHDEWIFTGSGAFGLDVT